MHSAKGPVLSGNVNRDGISRSHRSINAKVMNSRDVLKVGNVSNLTKFDHYQSPALKKIRITSANSQRSISAARKRLNSRGQSTESQSKVETMLQQQRVSALTTISKEINNI